MKTIFMFTILLSIQMSLLNAQVIEQNKVAFGEKYKLIKVYSNLGIPWGASFINDNLILLTDKSGYLNFLNIKTKKIIKQKFDLPISQNGQGGLLDVGLSPNFSKDKTIYFTYSKPMSKGITTALATGVYRDNKVLKLKDIFVSNAITTKGQHFGSRISFIDNYIYFSIGDRGKRILAQDLNNHAGSILRLNLDATIPKDNPFREKNKATSAIWSYGHRNPQGLFYDKSKKILYEVEHGPRGGDEVNKITKAKNYGWPIISYGKEYYANIAVGESTHKEGMQQPIKFYVPSIAPCGLLIYSGKLFKKWKGHLIMGALAKEHLNMVKITSNDKTTEKRFFEKHNWRIRNVFESPIGEIYFTTDEGDLYKITKS